MIQTIEKRVKLPEKAFPLTTYERYYGPRPDGIVFGIYINHDKALRQSILQNCARLEEAPFPCPVGNEGLRLVAAGEVLWLDDFRELPGMNGGGCAQVTVEYDPATERFARVYCNGPY